MLLRFRTWQLWHDLNLYLGPRWGLVGEPGFSELQIPTFSNLYILNSWASHLQIWLLKDRRQMIKVFWGDPGQNEWF
jgi:hypothetical protein